MKASQRIQVYQALAQALCPPTIELATRAADGTLRRLLDQALPGAVIAPGPLEQAGTPEEILDNLRQEYYRLFQNPRHRLELAESVYKPWATARLAGMPFAHEQGLLMGESARHLLELYRLTDRAVSSEFASRPDHLALELEFMAHLVANFGLADQTQFLSDHLDWLPDLLQAAVDWEPSPFYATVLATTQVWIEQEATVSRKELETLQRCWE